MVDKYRMRIRKGDLEIEIEGDQAFVEKHMSEFKAVVVGKEELPRPVEEPAPAPSEEKVEPAETELAKFYQSKQPKNHRETITLFAYWLTNTEQKPEFRPKDIEACYQQIGLRKPVNIPQVMKLLTAGDKGYLVRTGKRGRYTISERGKQLIEKELPRKK